MMSKETFSATRVLYILRKDLVERRKWYVNRILGIGVVLAVLAFLVTYADGVDIDSYNNEMFVQTTMAGINITLAKVYWAFMFCYVCYSIGSLNNVIAGRKARASWLLLPASTAEKYAARLVQAFVLVPLAGACMVGVSELLRCAFAAMLVDASVVRPVSPLAVVTMGKDWGLGEAFALFSVPAFFFFGSFLFRRGAFFKTVLLGGAILAAMTFATMAFVYVLLRIRYGYDFHGEIHIEGDIISHEWDAWIEALCWVVHVLVVALFIAWPYRKMKRMQL